MNNDSKKSLQHHQLYDSTTKLQRSQHETPDSESSNFECYQNFTAPEVFVQHIAGIVNQGDVELIVRAQKQMLQRFEKTNEMLLNCNALSNGRLKATNDDFKKHIKLINDMKKDLEYIFKKIRSIKIKIGILYPQAKKKAEKKLKNCSLSEESSPNGNESESGADFKLDDEKGTENIKSGKLVERKLSEECVTINYVQMEAGTDIGVCLNSDGKVEGNDSSDNDSSDCNSDTL
ncbi:kxDL motif-containing protein CG10681 [Contarinia nasturtii]|uniref:kxDL motif-containing protein CG10681 n=1 Tax=Contarinia nasturtii TaxID=265458 RepID=UPI0012D39E40|nr:kxDL motif-containing protein CG10681 [Contarinia nasturtii]XP_031639547.1 kxDL motif-containing protein CG10681 [Contarinia nasturtii]